MSNFNPPKINSFNNSEDDININININESSDISIPVKINELEQQKYSNFYESSFNKDNTEAKIIDKYSLDLINKDNNKNRLKISSFFEDIQIKDELILSNNIFYDDYNYKNKQIEYKEGLSLSLIGTNNNLLASDVNSENTTIKNSLEGAFNYYMISKVKRLFALYIISYCNSKEKLLYQKKKIKQNKNFVQRRLDN